MKLPTRDTHYVILEAEPLFLHGLNSLLSQLSENIVITKFSAVPDARQFCLQNPPVILLMDYDLDPGLRLPQSLAEGKKTTRVVAYSRVPELAKTQHAFKVGIYGFATRQDSWESLNSVISAALLGKRQVTPSIQSVLLGHLANGGLHCHSDRTHGLSQREREVLAELGSGREMREIATNLFVSIKTVETHCLRIREKLNIRSLHALRLFAAELEATTMICE